MRRIFELEFYMRENGKVPVQDFLYSLSSKLRAKAFSDIELLRNMGNELREPYVKPPETEIDRARRYMEDYKRRAEQ